MIRKENIAVLAGLHYCRRGLDVGVTTPGRQSCPGYRVAALFWKGPPHNSQHHILHEVGWSIHNRISDVSQADRLQGQHFNREGLCADSWACVLRIGLLFCTHRMLLRMVESSPLREVDWTVGSKRSIQRVGLASLRAERGDTHMPSFRKP